MLMRLRLLALDHLAGLGDSAQLVITIGEPLLADLGRALGPGDLDTQNARITLAAAFHAVGRVAEAIPLLQESLAAQVQMLGADFPGALALRNNLASAYRATGRPAEAIPLFEENAASCERLLGIDHPKTVASRHNLALARQEAEQAAGRVSEAIPLSEQTLDGQELVLGAGHLDVEAARDNPAAAQQKTDWIAETPPAADAAPDPVPEPPAAPAAEEPPTETVYEGLPPAAPAAGTDDDPAPEPASTAEPEPEPEAPKDLSEPGPPAAAVAEAPPAEELPAAPSAEELPAVPVTEPHAVLVVGPPDPVPVPPAAPADEEPPRAAPAAGTIDDPAPEPASIPEPGPEPETPKDLSKPGPPAVAVAEAPPAEELPAAPSAEELPAVPATEPHAVLVAEPPAPSRGRPARRRRRVPSLVAAIVVLLVAGGVAVALSRPHAGHSGHGPATASRPVGGQPRSTASQLAAAWVARQVARSAIVACDPLMCSALETQGVPAANLLILQTGTTSPLRAQVVVVTPAVRSQFGSRLDSVYAPSVIAGFGSGPDQVSVQVIAQNGPTAYLTALRQDMAARKAAGTQLLANKRILASAEARAQLRAGAVDSRLLIMLPALAAEHPIQILAFGQPAPGAGPGVPLCSADLSGSGQAAAMTDASYLSWLTTFVRAQLVPFAGSMAVLQQAGQPVVRVVFAQPSPLGLLAHT